MQPALTTRRLFLQPLSIEDAPQIQAIFPVWEVVRYLAASVPWPYPDDGALSYLRDVALPATERGEEWHWTLRPRSDPGHIIGCAGLFDAPDNNRGFWLGASWQRQGLMTEASDAITDFWFDGLGRPMMRSYKAVANQGSRRISERGGMRVIATMERDFVAGRLAAELWEISASAWRRHRLRRE
jgi:ribosomal-protein-alanine N-acetyltransferase